MFVIKERTYLAIDLKSFYASVECCERGLDPLNTNLVVADESRTDKTICLAVSPPLKSFGIPGRLRLFELKQLIKDINSKRKKEAPGKILIKQSYLLSELLENKSLELSFIIAPPRMAYYMDYSSKIYSVYLKHVAPEDIVVYSIDEVFIDITDYISSSRFSPRGFAKEIIKDVYETTGITATVGIGTNLFLSKVAMDIMAKHIEADKNGLRIAELDEMSFRTELWSHRPITDFWRISRGYERRLAENGMYTMGDIALCSVVNEDLLYNLFGKNAELLIDHAWGWEPCTIEAIRNFKPQKNSISSGQVLKKPYTTQKARTVILEMADAVSLQLVDKGMVTNQVTINVDYDVESLTDPNRCLEYHGKVVTDRFGRRIPQSVHGSSNLDPSTSSGNLITAAVSSVYDRIVDENLLIRRLTLTVNNVKGKELVRANDSFEQLDLFTDYSELETAGEIAKERLHRENKMQQAILNIKKKYGNNSIIKGMSLEEDATAKERNTQIGGHKK